MAGPMLPEDKTAQSRTGNSAVPVSRKESQAQTRARLIAVGREHFLREGLGAAVAERIAAEAGYTRGALYANFRNKEELFAAVVNATADRERENFRAILASPASVEARFAMLREAVGDMVTKPEWMLLQAELQANALRNAAVREVFLAQQAKKRVDGAALLREIAEALGLVLAASPEEVVAVLSSVAEGLAVRQAIAQSSGSEQETERARQLAMLCFDRLVASRRPVAE